MHTVKNYVMAQSLEEAWNLKQKGRNNVIIGGNLWLKMGKRNFVNAIDLSALGLDRIEEDGDGFRIGAMVSLHQLEVHEDLNRTFYGLFRDAVKHIVGVQFRNCATVGGSIFPRFGFSDVLTAFMACNTKVYLYHAGEISLREFAQMTPDNDILTHLYVKKDGRRTAYESFRMTQTDFPSLTCAVAKVGDRCETVIGARPKCAALVDDVAFSMENIQEYANQAAAKLDYGSNMRGSAAYREELSKILIGRCIARIMEEENAD